MVNRLRSGGKIEADRSGALADDGLVHVAEIPAVNVYSEASGEQTAERRAQTARVLVLRRARADRFAYRKGDQIAHAQRRCERERARAGAGHGMNVQRHAYAYHSVKVLPNFEEPPAARE